MKKYINIALVILVIIAVGIYSKNKGNVEPVTGCYVASLKNDVYILNIDNQNNEKVSGFLTFNNFEKDSSSGSIAGVYKDGILLAIYTFESEGTTSVMQVIFKKSENNFVRGYGDMSTTTNEFIDFNAVTYDASTEFKGGPCVENYIRRLQP